MKVQIVGHWVLGYIVLGPGVHTSITPTQPCYKFICFVWLNFKIKFGSYSNVVRPTSNVDVPASNVVRQRIVPFKQ